MFTSLNISAHEPVAELGVLGNIGDSSGHLRLLTDNMPALISYFATKDLCCRFANTANAKAYGFDTQSIVGKNVREIIGDDAYRIIRPYIQRAFASEQVSYERSLITPDGQHRVVDVNLMPHMSGTGAVLGVFVMINDVTKFRLAEDTVRESEARFGKFANASN